MKKTVSVLIAAVLITMLLAGCRSVSKAADIGYAVNVYVKDESGKPVAGVKVQACDDSLCMMVDTDSNGLAGFSAETKDLEVHILKVPAGYAPDAGSYRTDADGCLTVILRAA